MRVADGGELRVVILDVPVALVTGAARDRGIGRGIALALARNGFDVAVNDVGHEDEARRRVAEVEALGRRAVFLSRPTSAAPGRTSGSSPRPSRRSAASTPSSPTPEWRAGMPLVDVTRDDWEHIMGVNLHGVLYGCRAAAAQMRRQGGGGRIVVTSSVNAAMPFSPLGVYGASKHAVALLVGVLAREWGADGIAVNHVGPGWVDTNINDVSPDFDTEEKRARPGATIPFGARPAEPTRSARPSPTSSPRPTRRAPTSGSTAAS